MRVQLLSRYSHSTRSQNNFEFKNALILTYDLFVQSQHDTVAYIFQQNQNQSGAVGCRHFSVFEQHMSV